MGTIIEDTREDLKPIFQAKPDMRFATTFLSNKYRDYAVNGETIMDKATGEIFTKRKEDGRVVSFFQNQKFIDQMMLDLRVLISTHPELIHPGADDYGSFYLSTDYDVMTIHNEHDVDIQDNDIEISHSASNPFNRLEFVISNKSNGFIINLTTRNSDKVIVEYATGIYNKTFHNYIGPVDEFIAEKRKFDENPKWKNCNAILTYELAIKNSRTGQWTTSTHTDYIRINENSCVTIPQTLNLTNEHTVNIRIKKVEFYKLHFVLKYQEYLNNFIKDYNKLIYMDRHIYLRYITIGSFIDNASNINLLGNEFLVAIADMPYVYAEMNKLAVLTGESSNIISPSRPGDDVWLPNTLWAERLRDVYRNGQTVKYNTETDVHQLATYLSKYDDIDYVNFNATNVGSDIFVNGGDN